MKKYIFKVYALLFSAVSVSAQDTPPNAIIKSMQQIVDIWSENEMVEHVYKRITILNEKGREWAQDVIYYNKFRKIRNLTGVLLAADSSVVQSKLRDGNVQDVSAVSDFSLHEDGRYKVAMLTHTQYPFTVVYEYDIVHEGFFDLPTWYVQYPTIPIKHTRYEITAPTNYNFRYHKQNTDLQPIIQNGANQKKYIFEAFNQPKWEPEAMSYPWRDSAPAVLFTPNAFRLAGTQGSAESWQKLGAWYDFLQTNRQVLSPEKVAFVQNLVADAPTKAEKVRRIYAHLQKTTRYISVQLGIGGWQTYDAKYVEKNQYGDCKALTNYMLAMLQAVNIEAFPALVQAGERAADVIGEFPSNQFNHVILAVPDDGKYIWLENTSQTQAFGHLGAFTADRNVLLVKPNGGELVRTPKSVATDNLQRFTTIATLDDFGKATFQVQAHYTGDVQSDVRGTLATKTPRDHEIWLREEATDLPNLELISMDFGQLAQNKLDLDLKFSVTVSRYATKSGTRLFFKPNAMNRQNAVPPVSEKRHQPIVLPFPLIETDETRFQVPAGFVAEAVPPPSLIETSFGKYEAKITTEAGALIYTRKLELKTNRIAADQYNAFREFLRQVSLADQQQVVLKKSL